MKLSSKERIELQRRVSESGVASSFGRRAQLILFLADGFSRPEIRFHLDCSDSFIHRWSKRFEHSRLSGLLARHAGRKPYKLTEGFELRVLECTTKQRPADGSTYWSSRKLANALGSSVSHMTVSRIWAKHGLNPRSLKDAID